MNDLNIIYVGGICKMKYANDEFEKFYDIINNTGFDYVFDARYIDPSERSCDDDYPVLKLYRDKIKGDKYSSDRGVYLFFDMVVNNAEEFKLKYIVPLYVGRSITFLTRFNQYSHCQGWMGRYWDKHDDGMYTDMEFASTHIAIKQILDKEKRMYLEHELIGKLKPIFNRQ